MRGRATGRAHVVSSATEISGVSRSPSSPDTTRNLIPARLKAFAISGAGQALQCASHSPVVVFA